MSKKVITIHTGQFKKVRISTLVYLYIINAGFIADKYFRLQIRDINGRSLEINYAVDSEIIYAFDYKFLVHIVNPYKIQLEFLGKEEKEDLLV